MTSYQITQDYSPSEYDHAMLITCGSGLAEAIKAVEMNAFMMLSSRTAQPHIPSYDEYKRGDTRIKNLITSTDRVADRLKAAVGDRAELERVALDGLAATTMGMLADLSFKLRFAPSVKMYAQLVVAETYGLDLLKNWTFSDPSAASIYNDARSLYEEYRPTAGQCQSLVDAVHDAGEGDRDIVALMEITMDKMKERMGGGDESSPDQYPPLF